MHPHPSDLSVTVISLTDSHERRAHMQSELNRHGLEFRFYDATRFTSEQAHASPHYDRSRRLTRVGYEMTAGEIGCFLSHREVWKRIVAEAIPHCLVLEDDTRFVHPPGQFVPELLRRCSADVIKLHGIFDQAYTPIGTLACGLSLVSFGAKGAASSAAYIITARAAKRLLGLTGRFHIPIDNFLDEEFRHGLNVLSVHPYPVMTTDAPTTITARGKPKLGWHRRLMRELYRLPQSLHSRSYARLKILRRQPHATITD